MGFHNSGEWEDYAPTLKNTGRAAVAYDLTTSYAKRIRRGEQSEEVQLRLDVTSASAGGGVIVVSLPSTPANAAILIGTFAFYDASTGAGGTFNFGAAFIAGSDAYGSPHGALGVAAFATALGVGDFVCLDAKYEALAA